MVIISAAAVSAGSAMAQACAPLRPCVPALTGTDLYTKLGQGEGFNGFISPLLRWRLILMFPSANTIYSELRKKFN